MTGFFGADTEQLRTHGQLMVRNAQRVIELRDQLTPLVMDEAIWVGTDADRFRSEWSGRVAGLFETGHERVDTGGTDLERHAEEQDQASDSDGGSGGPGGEGDGGPGIFDILRKLAVKGQSMFRKFGDMMKFIKAIPNAFSEFAKLKELGLEKLWKAGYLDELFKGGKEWHAIAEKVFDKLGIPNGIGKFRPLEWAGKLDDVAPWLKTAGQGLAKVLPFVDVVTGGIQAFNGFKSGDIYSGVSGSLSALGGGLLIAAPFTGPFAPIVGAVGAGMGLVSAGMDIGRMVYENWDTITSTVGDVVNTVGDVASTVVNTVGDAASTVVDTVSDVASSASEAVGNAASTVVDTVGDVASSVGDAIGNGFDALGDAFGF